ncbi:hydroxysqualene dehydroxylase [Falsiroseomonas selenitidurans]|uniref:FAD-dependent oxidoreductase n=1 Tax=Falsiroseomonas selenitidurans TaxID=2716335 RepID=A0ABX1E6D5_9PROT|nr:FAD-dependent oxidoreductase [Falsiroseomonas selenitidurans]NKC32759.1 FAD-dependent oxidoreductase [Falsiroseomonas selenitidurans]
MTVHVVGAGVAGLAAALALVRGGRRVALHEAAPVAGGRARALPDGTDNGTHALLGANRAALRFLGQIGAREGWVEPEPAGLPVLDLETGTARRVALSPLGWGDANRRPEGVTLGSLLALLRLALPGPDRSVAAAFAGHPRLLRALVEPLTVAALNTPVAEASARLLGAVLRRLGGRGAARLFVARQGLGPDLVAPALATLACHGANLRTGSRLRSVTQEAGRATALDFGEAVLVLGPEDAVVLAVPPWEAARLLPGLPVPQRHAPILNLHFERVEEGPVRFIGLLGGLAQWVLVRPGGVSVTVSAADAAVGLTDAAAAARIWPELRQAALRFGLPGPWPEAPPPARAVRERRATPRHGLNPPPPPPRRPLANLVLAGDWTMPMLPATLESAVRSGEAAAAALSRASRPVPA